MVLGVISDEEIAANKGLPVMSLAERVVVASACKWVDEVAIGVPYDVTVAILDKYNCQFNAHGDDIAKNAQGEDSNVEMKRAGRMKIFKRTEGVSTTDIVGRLLSITLMSPEKEDMAGTAKPMNSAEYLQSLTQERKKSVDEPTEERKKLAVKFLATSRRLRQFSNAREPKATDRVVYVAGPFDIFHCGHVEFLQKARTLGDFLMVGIYDDAVPFLSLEPLLDVSQVLRQELPDFDAAGTGAQRPGLQVRGRGDHRRPLVCD